MCDAVISGLFELILTIIELLPVRDDRNFWSFCVEAFFWRVSSSRNRLYVTLNSYRSKGTLHNEVIFNRISGIAQSVQRLDVRLEIRPNTDGFRAEQMTFLLSKAAIYFTQFSGHKEAIFPPLKLRAFEPHPAIPLSLEVKNLSL